MTKVRWGPAGTMNTMHTTEKLANSHTDYFNAFHAEINCENKHIHLFQV
jgi:hypothetical protein